MNRPKDWFYLSIMTVLAVLLRAPLLHTGLTIDDACTAFVVEAQNWPDLVERIRTIEMSPPFYFVVLKAAVSICGFTTPVLAATSLFFSVAAVPLTYLLGRACMPKPDQDLKQHKDQQSSKVGLCAAFFATTSFLSIMYSHEARTYALASMLITLVLLLFVPFLDGHASRKRQLALFITTALTAYTHYTAVPYIGIMTLIALIYRKHGKSRSLLAVPPMVAGLATLIPWYPVLKYHGSVGTPWVDPTPLSKFPAVLAGNMAAISPLPVVPSYVFLTLVAPIVLGLYIVLKPREFTAKIRLLCQAPKLLTLTTLFIYSACVFGYITPYIFGYVRYMYPIAVTGWVLLAVVLVKLADKVNQLNPIQSLSRSAKAVAVVFMALITLGMSAQNVATVASQDRSGLRRLARDIAANVYGDAAFITSPDFVGIILVYYLKHECKIATKDLPEIIGFAYPEGGLLPPKHEGRAACWQDPQLMSKYEDYLKKIQHEGKSAVVLVRDTYTPTSKQMPTNEMTNKLEGLLKTKLTKLGPTETYAGAASSYKVTRYGFIRPDIHADMQSGVLPPEGKP
jgi:hypothetical protein